MSGTVAVVTGGARGFGREIAHRLAARGHAVLVTDVDAEGARRVAEEIGPAAWSMALDVRDAAAHRAAAAAAAERGRVAVWVNNAGVIRAGKAWEHTDEDVRLTVEANVLGVMWGSRAAVDAMRDGGGRILNVASLSALGPVPGIAVYAATKAAVLGFTTSLEGDLRLGGVPVRAHALCPDAADTAMVAEAAASPDSAILHSGPRLLRVEEVADAAMRLLEGRRVIAVLPRSRGVLARALAPFPHTGLRALAVLRRLGEPRRRRAAAAAQRA